VTGTVTRTRLPVSLSESPADHVESTPLLAELAAVTVLSSPAPPNSRRLAAAAAVAAAAALTGPEA
jgi:hypothetical protein